MSSREEYKEQPRREETPRWEKPEDGKLKLNVDIAVGLGERVGLGVVL